MTDTKPDISREAVEEYLRKPVRWKSQDARLIRALRDELDKAEVKLEHIAILAEFKRSRQRQGYSANAAASFEAIRNHANEALPGPKRVLPERFDASRQLNKGE